MHPPLSLGGWLLLRPTAQRGPVTLLAANKGCNSCRSTLFNNIPPKLHLCWASATPLALEMPMGKLRGMSLLHFTGRRTEERANCRRVQRSLLTQTSACSWS